MLSDILLISHQLVALRLQLVITGRPSLTGINEWSESPVWGGDGKAEVAEADGTGWSWGPAAHPLQPAPFCSSKAETPRNHCWLHHPSTSTVPCLFSITGHVLWTWLSKNLGMKLLRSIRLWAPCRELLPMQTSGLCCPVAGTFVTVPDLLIWKSSSV